MPKIMLAADHDNQEDLKRLKDIDGCLFKLYWDYVELEWHAYEDRALDGARKYKTIGRPWVKLKFPILTVDEWKYLFVTLNGSSQSSYVTAHLPNLDLDDYSDYNGTLHINEGNPDSYEWGERKNVEIEIRDLILIT